MLCSCLLEVLNAVLFQLNFSLLKSGATMDQSVYRTQQGSWCPVLVESSSCVAGESITLFNSVLNCSRLMLLSSWLFLTSIDWHKNLLYISSGECVGISAAALMAEIFKKIILFNLICQVFA